MTILLEACLDSVELAIAAERGGARRIELCDRLDIGGTTPSEGLIRAVVSAVRIPVFAIVRPRGGDFYHSSAEVDVMKRDAGRLRALGAAGMVFGILGADSTVDATRNREVLHAADGLPATFHLAFERVPDQATALDSLIEVGFERVLTKGGGQSALEGVDGIRRLVERAGDRIAVMAGGSVREGNVREIVARTGVTEIHTRGLAIAEILRQAESAPHLLRSTART